MKAGDIVRLKSEHHMRQFIKGECVITQVVQYNNKNRKTRYHIKNSQDCMTWVYLDEIDLVSDIRDQKIKKLGL